jgi:multimeric flavodoxin WrbA
MDSKILKEGAEYGDLARLVLPSISIDEYRSKMGEDKDIVVVGFIVYGREPSEDLVEFIEKSYDWVLDADISSGEIKDGNYMVFVEIERTPKVGKYLITMLTDLMNLTKQKLSDWTFTYFKNATLFPVTIENLEDKIITSPEKYEIKAGPNLDEGYDANQLKMLAGIKIDSPKVVDPLILNLQYQAGIK